MVDLSKYIEGEGLTGDVIYSLPADKRTVVILPFGHGWEQRVYRGETVNVPVIPVELNGEKYEWRLTKRMARELKRHFDSKDTEKWSGQSVTLTVTKKQIFGKETNILEVKKK